MLRRARLVFSVVGEKVRPSPCSAARHASSITLRAVSVVDDSRLHTAYGRHGVRLCRPGGVGELSRASPSLLDDTEECPAQPTTREVACIWTFLKERSILRVASCPGDSRRSMGFMSIRGQAGFWRLCGSSTGVDYRPSRCYCGNVHQTQQQGLQAERPCKRRG